MVPLVSIPTAPSASSFWYGRKRAGIRGLCAYRTTAPPHLRKDMCRQRARDNDCYCKWRWKGDAEIGGWFRIQVRKRGIHGEGHNFAACSNF